MKTALTRIIAGAFLLVFAIYGFGQTATPTPVADPKNDTLIDQIKDPEKVLQDSRLESTEPHATPPRPDIKRLGTNGAVLALSLDDAVRIVLENNNDIEIARDEVRYAETNLRALRGFYDPVLSISPLFDYSIEPNANTIGGSRFNPGGVRQTDFFVSSSVTQSFTSGGGSYSAFFNNLRRSTDNSLLAFDRYYTSSLGVTFTQPLLRNRRIDRARRDIRIQNRRIAQADSDFRQRTIEIIADVQRAYWNLVFALREQQNRLNNIDRVREQFRAVEGRIQEGSSSPLERVQVEAELARQQNELLNATKSVTFTENKLKQLILPNPLVQEWSAEVMPIDEPQVDFAPIDLNEILQDAHENRPEFVRLKTETEINEIDRRYLRDQTKPRIDISATIASTGLAGNPLSNSGLPEKFTGGYGQSLGNLFGFETRTVVVGVTFELPFRNRTAKERLAGAEIRRQQLNSSTKSLAQVVEAEVRNAAQELETARQSTLRAREARQAAEIQLAGEQQLFKNGNSTTFLVFERTNQLINARTSELKAETDYSTALTNLQRATGTTLKAANVSIDSTREKPRTNDLSSGAKKDSMTSGILPGNYLLPPREISTNAVKP